MLIIQQQNIHPNTFPSVNPVKQKHCYYVVTAFFCTAFLTNDIHITKTDFSSCPVYESGCRDCELQSIAGECFSTQGKFLLSCFLHLFIIQLTYTSHKPLLTISALQDIQRTMSMALRLKTRNSAENSWQLRLTWSYFMSKSKVRFDFQINFPKAKSDLFQGSLETRLVPEEKCGAQVDPQFQKAREVEGLLLNGN